MKFTDGFPGAAVFGFLKWEQCEPRIIISVPPWHHVKNVTFFTHEADMGATAVDNAKIKRKQVKAVMARYCSCHDIYTRNVIKWVRFSIHGQSVRSMSGCSVTVA
jgi:hypothetical protein